MLGLHFCNFKHFNNGGSLLIHSMYDSVQHFVWKY